ncbi:MAG: N-acetylmuramic acid 6-phosphate etherase [Chloroherpetonaceae bacterium]|nr:N-acetylmuramic acid 6-phosphate etherase [Chloroherpetonaceae bacterium]
MATSKSKLIFREISSLLTEQVNTRTKKIDEAGALEIARLINREDARVAKAVGESLPEIARAIQLVAKAFQNGGRLFYLGAGTSGRLGILDASECPPTFGVSPDLVQGIIAGGNDAVFRSVEGAEDDETAASNELKRRGFSKHDVLFGISASKRTPFVLGGLRFARKLKAKTIFLTSNPDVKEPASVVIRTLVGPEVIMGSTRLKAGTSHKMVLNMVSTGAMILNGKTYGNMMIDLQQTNLKLVERTKRIFMLATGADYETAEALLETAGGKLKTAITMYFLVCTKEEAEESLKKANGFVKRAVNATLDKKRR